MRHLRLAPAIFLTIVASAAVAAAQELTLAQPLLLRAGPGPHHRVVAAAPAGATLVLLRDGTEWTRVSLDGRRGYVASSQIIATARPVGVPPVDDPTCDYGYPYSGSGAYFAGGLTELRHSEPLGFLFGYHRFYPC